MFAPTMEDNRVGVQGLKDASLAGTEQSDDCTLILTAGKKAMSLVEIIMRGKREKYGIYAVGGYLINIRRTPAEVQRDLVVNAIRKTLGLEFGRTYNNDEDFRTLRYGRVMLVVGQVAYGSRVKGLIVNLFHVCWPSLLRKTGFLMQMITPVVKVFNQKDEDIRTFYSLEHFKWSEYNIPDETGQSRWVIRYYNSLESFSHFEICWYFFRIENYCVKFKYGSIPNEDDSVIESAFALDENRTSWLQEALQEALLNASPLYEEGINEVTYKDFINREYLLCYREFIERVIPSVVDGLTRNQRMVLYTCFEWYPCQVVNVRDLVQAVNAISAYKDSSHELKDTVMRMAQNFVGRGNINLLLPDSGHFGTRAFGGEDAGTDQTTYIKVNDLARLLFPDLDRDILVHRIEMGRDVEPEHYLPAIPLILVNGASGFGAGWNVKIPMYHPMDVINNLIRLLKGREPVEMKPWFRNFHGDVERLDDDRQFLIHGKIFADEQNRDRVIITELPVGSWTRRYRGEVLERMMRDGEIVAYEDHSTDTVVDFLVILSRNLPEDIDEELLRRRFKLVHAQRYAFLAYDGKQNVTTFQNANDLLRNFYRIRLQDYERRRHHMISRATTEFAKLQLVYTSPEQLWMKDLEALLQRPEIVLGNGIGLAEAIARLHS